MTREKATEYLKGLGIEEPTDEQVTHFLETFHNQELEQKKQIDNLTKQIGDLTKASEKYSDYDDIKKQLDDINKANMTEQQKLEKDKAEIEKNLKESKIVLNKSLVKEKLSGLGIDNEQLDNLVNSMVSDNKDASLQNADLYVQTLSAMKEATIKATKEELINANVKPNMKDSVQSGSKTWNDLTYEEKLELKRSNTQEYEQLKQTR